MAKLRVEGFRGIRRLTFDLNPNTVLVGPNGCGKSTTIDALSLVLGRRMVKQLTEHDFLGSNPSEADRIRIVATLTGFGSDDPDEHTDWFRFGRAVHKWIDADGNLWTSAADGRSLAAQVAFAARFDHEDLVVEAVRYWHDDDDETDPFDDDQVRDRIPFRLLNEVGYFVLPTRRDWDAVASFNSELFRRTVSNAAGIPASEILVQRDNLRDPRSPLEESPALAELVGRINGQLASLIAAKPRFRLRVTSGDSESLLKALLPHYATDEVSLPASRHGSGLVSLQSLLLLLEVGRARKEKGLSFVLALEEPELHLAPGVQVRLLSESIRIADQTICTTHSPRVAAMHDATDVLVMSMPADVGPTEPTDLGSADVANDQESDTHRVRPLLRSTLSQDASNNERKLYIQNRATVVEALMHSFVLIPEGRFDVEWLLRLASVGEARQIAPPFTTVFGVAPTENSAVTFTHQKLSELRSGIFVLVDGDGAGDGYVKDLSSAAPPPQAIIQWPTSWTIEDVVIWALEAGGEVALDAVVAELQGESNISTIEDLRGLLKTPNKPRQGIEGLKENVVAHDAIAGAMLQNEDCVARVARLCDSLVHVALGSDHDLMSLDTKQVVPLFRFQP